MVGEIIAVRPAHQRVAGTGVPLVGDPVTEFGVLFALRELDIRLAVAVDEIVLGRRVADDHAAAVVLVAVRGPGGDGLVPGDAALDVVVGLVGRIGVLLVQVRVAEDARVLEGAFDLHQREAVVHFGFGLDEAAADAAHLGAGLDVARRPAVADGGLAGVIAEESAHVVLAALDLHIGRAGGDIGAADPAEEAARSVLIAPLGIHPTLDVDAMRLASQEGAIDRRAAIAAQDAGGPAVGIFDHSVREGYIVAVAVQHAEEARIAGVRRHEVADRMAVAVKIDEICVG